ncbi:DUF3822 family protein [Marixanthomonas spongiae]|uniref:DUF3822 domain-containing protein n=1 Tax=Marixanthomonas spongiae TaxID=2174845 RepID=A0A2U0HY36_9FLAO|nr:DUF3822 family protein [Marixanthomonas spongiae]PVW13783.1 DUF3822 domain-containing protein [Marixanthomonas spongiae]
MTLGKTNNNTIHYTKRLSVQISLTGLSFLVTSSDGNEVLYFWEERFETPFTPEELLSNVESAMQTHEQLQEGFDQVTLLYATDLYTLVPRSLFDETKASEYLKFNSKILANDYISHDILENQDIVVVYVPYININNYFFERYGSFQYYHATSILIPSILTTEKFTKESKVFVNVRSESFDSIVVKEGQLMLCNTFSFKTAEDFIYYLLFCMEQLHLNPERTPVILTGSIEKEGDIFNVLYTYIRDVSFVSGKLVEDFKSFSESSFPQLTAPHQHFVLKNSL